MHGILVAHTIFSVLLLLYCMNLTRTYFLESNAHDDSQFTKHLLAKCLHLLLKIFKIEIMVNHIAVSTNTGALHCDPRLQE